MTKHVRTVDEDARIRATVFDFANANPLAVRLTDTSGDYVGAGGGTQYDEDTVSTAADKITMAGVVRKDTGASLVGTDGDRTQLQVDAGGALRVTGGGGGTEYVVDAIAPVAPTGTASLMERDDVLSALTEIEGDWTNMRANANGALWVKNDGTLTVDGSAVTQPVSAASLPLPTGAATSALQTQPGVDIGDVTVNNAAGAAAVNVQDGGNSLTVDGSVSIAGAVDTELTTADLDTGVGTDTRAVVGLVGSASGGGALIPGSATDGLLVNLGVNNDVGLNAGTNNIGDVDVLTVPAPLSTSGGGTEATALRVTLASDSTGLVSVDDNGGALTVDNAGTFATQAAQSGTWTVQPGNTANSTAWLVSERPAVSGGLTMHKTTSAATTNATSVKASAGQIYAIQAFNVNAAVRYLKLYNKASAPTVGTDTPVKTLAIPGNTAGAGFVASWPCGLAFATGIAFALTTEATDAGTTGVAVNEITVNVDYA